MNELTTKNNVTNVTIDKKPTYLTAISAVSAVLTAGYSVWAGFQIKKALDELPEDADILTKAKTIAPYGAPVIIGTGVTVGCAVAANSKNMKHIAELTAVYSAAKLDKNKLMQHKKLVEKKAKELLGDEKAKEFDKEVAKEEATQTIKEIDKKLPTQYRGYDTKDLNPYRRIMVHDAETGYIFTTAMADFMWAVNVINDKCETRSVSIAEFYETLLGDDYISADTHKDVGFGAGCDVQSLRPEFEGELAKDMTLVYSLSYQYSTLSSPVNSWDYVR